MYERLNLFFTSLLKSYDIELDFNYIYKEDNPNYIFGDGKRPDYYEKNRIYLENKKELKPARKYDEDHPSINFNHEDFINIGIVTHYGLITHFFPFLFRMFNYDTEYFSLYNENTCLHVIELNLNSENQVENSKYLHELYSISTVKFNVVDHYNIN